MKIIPNTGRVQFKDNYGKNDRLSESREYTSSTWAPWTPMPRISSVNTPKVQIDGMLCMGKNVKLYQDLTRSNTMFLLPAASWIKKFLKPMVF